MEYKITTPLKEEDIVKLNAGDKITGVIYSKRYIPARTCKITRRRKGTSYRCKRTSNIM